MTLSESPILLRPYHSMGLHSRQRQSICVPKLIYICRASPPLAIQLICICASEAVHLCIDRGVLSLDIGCHTCKSLA